MSGGPRKTAAVAAPDESENETAKAEATAEAKAQDYNSSRSNNSSVKVPADATDYNSSRSNRTRALDTDDDGDSIEAEVCSNGVDNDCDAPRDADPANHNSTRSR